MPLDLLRVTRELDGIARTVAIERTEHVEVGILGARGHREERKGQRGEYTDSSQLIENHGLKRG
jgi:hypothetical protein